MKKDNKKEITTEKLKKEKSEGYILKKNTGMKLLRAIFWIILVFIFIRGVITIFRPDKEETVNQIIADFKNQYSTITNENEEVMSFCQNFVKDYMTYSLKGEEDYKNRISTYVSNTFLNTTDICDFKGSSEVDYVKAYRMEDYSQNQKDVYVLVNVKYCSQELDENGETYTTKEEKSQIVLKVPVYIKDGKYVVENLPQFVSDSNYLKDYKFDEFYGTSLTDIQNTAVNTSIENFLNAYYDQDASVIEYYLSDKADKSKFTGLDGRFHLVKIDDIKSYIDESSGKVISLVTYTVEDSKNGVKMLQKINLSVQEKGGKYYIDEMNVRTGNLN